MPCSRQICLVSRMFSIETGWPPPRVVRDGDHAQRDVRRARLRAMNSPRAAVSRLPLKSAMPSGSVPSAMGRSTASAPENSMLARVVSKWELLGMCLPWPPTMENRIRSAARPWWVGMMCLQAGQLADFVLEAEEAAGAGVGFVAAHDARPLVRAHGGGAAVGQQVDQHVLGRDGEQVIAAAAQEFLALLEGGELDRLDRLDLERLDDGFHGWATNVCCSRAAAKLGHARMSCSVNSGKPARISW